MNLLNNKDAAWVGAFTLFSAWQFPMSQKKLKNTKVKNYSITIEKLSMHIHPALVCAKYQWKLTAKIIMLQSYKTVMLKQHHYILEYLHLLDHLLLVRLWNRDSLQLFNCMAHISTISVIFPLFSSLSFPKTARHLQFMCWVDGLWRRKGSRNMSHLSHELIHTEAKKLRQRQPFNNISIKIHHLGAGWHVQILGLAAVWVLTSSLKISSFLRTSLSSTQGYRMHVDNWSEKHCWWQVGSFEFLCISICCNEPRCPVYGTECTNDDPRTGDTKPFFSL